MKYFFLIFFTTISTVLIGQDIKTIYAYRHVIPRGNIPVVPKEQVEPQGTDQPQEDFSKPKFVYYIFVETNNGKAPSISKIIVDNKEYQCTVQKITSYPVEYEYFDGSKQGKVVMISSQKKNIYKLELNVDTKTTATESKSRVRINYKVGKLTKLKVLTKIVEMPSSMIP